jgi:hypothetical protein
MGDVPALLGRRVRSSFAGGPGGAALPLHAFAALSPALPAVTERFNSSQSDVDIVVEFFESE